MPLVCAVSVGRQTQPLENPQEGGTRFPLDFLPSEVIKLHGGA